MRTKLLVTVGLVLVMGAIFAQQARAQDPTTAPDNRWFISVMGSYPSTTGTTHFDSWGGFFGIAKPITSHFGLALNYQQYEVRPYDVIPVNQKLLGIDMLFFAYRGTWNPYFELGAGYTRMSYDSYGLHPGGDDSSTYGTVGFGVIWRVASYFDIRVDIRYNGTFSDFAPDEQELGNIVGSVGFAIPFGTPPQAVPATLPPPPPTLDGDNDGVPNNLDHCLATPRGVNVNAHGCAQDSDNDGVPNSRDLCSGTRSGVNVNVQGCPLDNDDDGVANDQDRCPNTAIGTPVDVHGCPITKTITLQNVHFAFNSSELNGTDQRELNDLAVTLRKYPKLKAEIAGYTGSIGPAAYNQKLSKERAQSVKRYLVAHGINPNRLTTRGYGEKHPIATNTTKLGRAKNRRVELHIKNLYVLKGKASVEHK